MGTSLTVMPFSNLITESSSSVPRVYINLSKPGQAGGLGWILGMGKNIDFSRPTDLKIHEKCDETIKKIINLLKWENEFNELENKIMKL